MSCKIFFTTISFFLFVTIANAQLHFGIKASYTQSFVDKGVQLYDNVDNYVIYRLQLEQQQIFPSIGAVAYYGFENTFTNRNLGAFLQLEMLYNYRRTHFNFENFLLENDTPSPIIKSSSFLRFPMMGGLNYRKLKVGIGPIFSFMLHDQSVFGAYPYIDERFRTFEPATSILVGTRFDDLSMDISYEYHFNGVSEFIYHRNEIQGFKQQPHYLSFNVTYLFPFRPRRR